MVQLQNSRDFTLLSMKYKAFESLQSLFFLAYGTWVVFPVSSVHSFPLIQMYLSGKTIAKKRLRAEKVLQVALLVFNLCVNECLHFFHCVSNLVCQPVWFLPIIIGIQWVQALIVCNYESSLDYYRSFSLSFFKVTSLEI